MIQGNHNTVLNWSSGKDAALAYYLLQQDEQYNVTQLLTTVNNEQDRVVMHGVREELLDLQAERIGVKLNKIKLPTSPNHDVYNNAMTNALNGLKEAGVSHAAFGDIFLDDLKKYREKQLASVGFQSVFPLWKKSTVDLVHMVEQVGIEAMIVCVSEQKLGKEFLGRKVDTSLLNDLPKGVDPCGEHGEFHTFVYNAPYFSSPIPIQLGESVHRSYKNEAGDWDAGFWFLDVLLD
ncbi:MAG: diphthine--ammonia ligase [Chitinophagales bacterium]|nr:diphthine--ammonia ligase [Chitinophagaceae bacterium]MCB9064931.1 diphthine--ammonia ligase [Chitinophagales bacterium]